MLFRSALDNNGTSYRVAVIKNRHGKADPTAESFLTLAAEPSLMTIYNSFSDLNIDRTRRGL